MIKGRSIFILLTILSIRANAQTRELDSLKLRLKDQMHDTVRCKILMQLSETADEGEWQEYNEDLMKLSEAAIKKHSASSKESKFYKKYYASALNNIGYLASVQGNIPESSKNLEKSYLIFEEIGDELGMAFCLLNMANNYNNQGKISQSLSGYNRAVKIFEIHKNNEGITRALNNMANIFLYQEQYEKALEYYKRCMNISLGISDKMGYATNLNNIGFVYQRKGDNAKALEYYKESLKISEEIDDKAGIATCLNNIGLIYSRTKRIKEALKLYYRSLELEEAAGNLPGIAQACNSIGWTYFFLKNYPKAMDFTGRGLEISRKIGFPESIKNSAEVLYGIYKTTGNYKKALENYELSIQMRDSLTNEATRKASIRSQLKHEYELRSAADSVSHAKESEIKNVELKRQSAEIKAKKNQQYALFGGLFLVCLFGVFMFNRYKVTQKQKLLIEHQKEIVEDQKKLVEAKQKEILDSIHYAKRIQDALLPAEKYVVKCFENLKR